MSDSMIPKSETGVPLGLGKKAKKAKSGFWKGVYINSHSIKM